MQQCTKDGPGYSACIQKAQSEFQKCDQTDPKCTCKANGIMYQECYSEKYFRVDGSDCSSLGEQFAEYSEGFSQTCGKYLDSSEENSTSNSNNMTVGELALQCIKDGPGFNACTQKAQSDVQNCDQSDTECSCTAGRVMYEECYSEKYFRVDGSDCSPFGEILANQLDSFDEMCTSQQTNSDDPPTSSPDSGTSDESNSDFSAGNSIYESKFVLNSLLVMILGVFLFF